MEPKITTHVADGLHYKFWSPAGGKWKGAGGGGGEDVAKKLLHEYALLSWWQTQMSLVLTFYWLPSLLLFQKLLAYEIFKNTALGKNKLCSWIPEPRSYHVVTEPVVQQTAV